MKKADYTWVFFPDFGAGTPNWNVNRFWTSFNSMFYSSFLYGPVLRVADDEFK
ncbi:MAG: hypothetical protein KDC12_00160 [Flavobacteriales bacterium]|nr:hypothetical protein [Flavobacteriales bacterium]